MKALYLLLLLPLAAACRKEEPIVTHTCKMPTIILYNQQYSVSEWDTIVVKVYNKGFLPPVITDTLLSINNTQQLQVNHDPAAPKDYSIYLPSVNRTYKLYDISITENTVQAAEDFQPDCYHNIAFTLDSQRISDPYMSKGKALIELKK